VVWDGTAGPVAVAVFDVRGVQVRDLGESRSGGSEWDGRDDDGRPVPSGVYWARVTSPDRQTSVPMLRLR
jgi:flagellar hook assembly protein FlgD